MVLGEVFGEPEVEAGMMWQNLLNEVSMRKNWWLDERIDSSYEFIKLGDLVR